MSSGNATSEYTRLELAIDEEMILRESALTRNAVLRRAVAIACCDQADAMAQAQGYAREPLPDAGMVLMLCAVMRASEEVEQEKAG
ncbi:hypothetical protein [Occallatibacter riparius]|uniref:Uncharacterized protein n=1 Tax=Occallatibacter riparius TaxID=1002689 RepID=A0A9J7BP18_9BACT|nr:hypothetical protein [Occallatibacter riparius]UWZ84628.1 hypothetical protein MOP44_01535 [Occallatibacter riparius]